MSKIKNISSLEILDSRGIPTIKTTIEAEDGTKTWASIPSGSSTGKFEAKELRDKDKRFSGKGVRRAVFNVLNKIAPKLKGKEPKNQREIDEIMLKIDGTSDKSRLGANAILSVSLSCAKLAAKSENLTLYKYLNLLFFPDVKPKLPTPFSVVIESGKHSAGTLDIQEFIIAPTDISPFSEKLRAVSEIYQTLGIILQKKSQSTNVGQEGAYGPNLKTNTEAMDLILEAINKAGYSGKVKLALDVAASEFYHQEDKNYYLKSQDIALTTKQLIGLYNEWISRYPIISIEDGLEEEDFDGWAEMTQKLSSKIKIIGDDFFVTNPERLKKGIKKKSATGVIIKPNQIGTLSETVEAIKLAREADWEYIISHRGGDTSDTFIVDLAVASGANFIKIGAPCRGERIEKYNRLLEINQEISK